MAGQLSPLPANNPAPTPPSESAPPAGMQEPIGQAGLLSANPIPSLMQPVPAGAPPAQTGKSLADFINDAHAAGYAHVDPNIIATIGSQMGNNNNSKLALAHIKQSLAIPNKTSQYLHEPSAVAPAQTAAKVIQDHVTNTGITPIPIATIKQIQQQLIDAKLNNQPGMYAPPNAKADGIWNQQWADAYYQYGLDVRSQPGLGNTSSRSLFSTVFDPGFLPYAIPLVSSIIRSVPADALKALGGGLKMTSDAVDAFNSHTGANGGNAKSQLTHIANWISNLGQDVQGQKPLTDAQYGTQSNWEHALAIANTALIASTLGKVAEQVAVTAKGGVAAGKAAGATNSASALFTKVEPMAPKGPLNWVMNSVMPNTADGGARFAFTNWLKNSPSAMRMAPNLTAKVNAGLDATATEIKNAYKVARRIAATPYSRPITAIAGQAASSVSTAGLKFGLLGHADNWMGDPNAPVATELNHLKPIAGMTGLALNLYQIAAHGDLGSVPALSDSVGNIFAQGRSIIATALDKNGLLADWERGTQASVNKTLKGLAKEGITPQEFFAHVQDQADQFAAKHAAQPLVDAAVQNGTLDKTNADAMHLAQLNQESVIRHDPELMAQARASYFQKPGAFAKDVAQSMLRYREDPRQIHSSDLASLLKARRVTQSDVYANMHHFDIPQAPVVNDPWNITNASRDGEAPIPSPHTGANEPTGVMTPEQIHQANVVASQPLSKAQLIRIQSLMKSQGLNNRDDAMKYVSDTVGRNITSRKELTNGEANMLIKKLAPHTIFSAKSAAASGQPLPGKFGLMRNDVFDATAAEEKAMEFAKELEKARPGYVAPTTLDGLKASSDGTDFGAGSKPYQMPKTHLPESATPAEAALRDKVMNVLGSELGRNIQDLKYVPTQDLIKLIAEKANLLARKLKLKEPAPLEPAYEGGSPLFHGSSTNIEGKVSPDIWGKSDHNLFGDGFYTTDSASVAKGYTKKGGNSEPTIHSVKWNGTGTPKLINLDQTANSDLRTVFQDEIKYVTHVDYTNLEEALAKPNVTGRELFQALRYDLKEYGSGDHAAETFQAISDKLSQNYDGLQHIGGLSRNGNGVAHNVTIWLHPKDLSVTKLDQGAPQHVIDAVKETNDLGYTHAWGTDIGLNFTEPPIDAKALGVQQNMATRTLDKWGINFTNMPDEASVSSIGAKNGMNDVLDAKKAQDPTKFPLWVNGSRITDFIQRVIKPEIGAPASIAIGATSSRVGKLLTLKGISLAEGGAWKKELDALMKQGGFTDETGKFVDTSTLPRAKVALKEILATDSSPQSWLRKDFMKALTTKGDENGMMKDKFGNDVEAIGMSPKDASDLWYGMKKGLRSAPAYQSGTNVISRLMNSTFGLDNVPLQINGHRLLDLTGPVQSALIQARYLFSPRQAYLRVVKSALKGVNENMPYSMNASASFKELPQAAQDAAKALTQKVYGKGETMLDPNDFSTKEFASKDYFNIFDPQAVLERTVHYVSQNMVEEGKAVDTPAGVKELKSRVDAINNYGERTAAEKTLNGFFFPFSFEKTVVRELGSHLLDNPSTRLMVAGAIHVYNSTDGQKMDKWLQDNVPLWKEVEKFNPFFHGTGLGQLGGINRTPFSIIEQALYGGKTGKIPDFSKVSDLEKLNLFVHMMQPKPITGTASIKAAVNLIPALRDLNNIFIGAPLSGSAPFSWKTAGGEMRASIQDLAHQANSAIHTFMGQEDTRPYQGQGYQPYALQQTNAWNLRNQYVAGLLPALQANSTGGNITFLPGTPAVGGLKVNRSNIDKLVAQIYPAWDPNLAKYSVARDSAAALERVSIQKDIAKYGPNLLPMYDNFTSGSNTIQSEIQKASLDPTYDYSKIMADMAKLREWASWLAAADSNFPAFYARYYASKYGPLKGL